MFCNTCGGVPSPGQVACDTCGTPVGAPALRPGFRTYPVRVVGLLAVVALVLSVLAEAAYTAFSLIARAVAQAALENADPDPLVVLTLVEALVALPGAIAGIAAAVLVIVWCYRARKNLDAFPGAAPSLGPGWAVGGWFVPFANLVIPYRVVAQIARASLWRSRTPRYVMLWWAAWLAYLLGGSGMAVVEGVASLDLPLEPQTTADIQLYVDYYGSGLPVRMVTLILGAVAAAALITVIRRISAAQEARIRRGAPPPVMPGTHVMPQVAPPAGGGTIRA